MTGGALEGRSAGDVVGHIFIADNTVLAVSRDPDVCSTQKKKKIIIFRFGFGSFVSLIQRGVLSSGVSLLLAGRVTHEPGSGW